MTLILSFIALCFALAAVQAGFFVALSMLAIPVAAILSGVVALICLVRSFVNNQRRARHW